MTWSITRKQDSYEKGDIVAFQVGRDGRGGQVIHRVIGGNGVKGYRMQGDNNPDPDPWRPTDADVIGKAWIHLDQKAFLMHLPRNPTFAGIAAGLVTLLVLGLDARPKRRQEAEPETPVRTGSNAEDAVLVSSVGAQSASSEPAAVPSQRVPSPRTAPREPPRTVMSRRRWIVGALLLVTVVATLAGLRPGAAAQLEVRSAPLQTWRLDVEPPLPPLVEDESAEDELPQPTTPDSLTPAVPAPETTLAPPPTRPARRLPAHRHRPAPRRARGATVTSRPRRHPTPRPIPSPSSPTPSGTGWPAPATPSTSRRHRRSSAETSGGPTSSRLGSSDV